MHAALDVVDDLVPGRVSLECELLTHIGVRKLVSETRVFSKLDHVGEVLGGYLLGRKLDSVESAYVDPVEVLVEAVLYLVELTGVTASSGDKTSVLVGGVPPSTAAQVIHQTDGARLQDVKYGCIWLAAFERFVNSGVQKGSYLIVENGKLSIDLSITRVSVSSQCALALWLEHGIWPTLNLLIRYVSPPHPIPPSPGRSDRCKVGAGLAPVAHSVRELPYVTVLQPLLHHTVGVWLSHGSRERIGCQ